MIAQNFNGKEFERKEINEKKLTHILKDLELISQGKFQNLFIRIQMKLLSKVNQKIVPIKMFYLTFHLNPNYFLVKSQTEHEKLIAKLVVQKAVAFDIETTLLI